MTQLEMDLHVYKAPAEGKCAQREFARIVAQLWNIEGIIVEEEKILYDFYHTDYRYMRQRSTPLITDLKAFVTRMQERRQA